MSLYTIAYTNDRGQPQGYYFRADAYDPEYRRVVEQDPTPTAALAAKWTTVGDAVTFATQHRDLGNPDAGGLNDWWAVVGVPAYLAREIEAAAQHAWNHRHCHAENGRAA